MIRHKRLILVATPLGLMWAGTHFFLDRGLRTLLEKGGSAVNGARVDVGSVSTRFFPPRLVLRRLQITDQNAPLTNAVEIDQLRFSLEGKPLFWKKFIVDHADLSGIRTGTPRARSGALAPEKKETDAPKAEGDSPLKGLGLDTEALVGDLSADTLASYQKARTEWTRAQSTADDWKKRLDALDTERLKQKARAFSEGIKTLPSGVEGLKAAPALISEGKALLAEVERARDTQRSLQEALKTDLRQSKEALADIERLKSADVDRIVGKVKSGFSVEGVAARLVGPAWVGRVKTALGWFHKARKLMPAKSEKNPPPALKAGGEDIVFPFHHAWPTFHLKTASLSGVTAGENPLTYTGALRDVSSDPARVGRPTVLSLAGGEEKGPRRLALDVTLDATGETPKESVRFLFSGVPLAGQSLGDLGGPVRIGEGTGQVNASLEGRGEKIQGTIDLSAPSLRLDHTATGGGNARLNALVHDVLANVTQADVIVGVSGDVAAPQLSIKTSLDKALAQGVQQAFQKQWEDARAQVQKKVAGLVDGEKEKLGQLAKDQTGILTQKLGEKGASLDAVKEEVQKALEKAAGGGTGKIPLGNLKNIFKKK